MQVSLEDACNPQVGLDIFKEDPDFQENEKKYEVGFRNCLQELGLQSICSHTHTGLQRYRGKQRQPSEAYLRRVNKTALLCLVFFVEIPCCVLCALLKHDSCSQAIKKEILGEDSEEDEDEDEDEEDDDDKDDDSDEEALAQAPMGAPTQRIQVSCLP